MIVLTDNTPLIIARNEFLRKAEDYDNQPEARLKALSNAEKLSEQIMSRARKIVDNFKLDDTSVNKKGSESDNELDLPPLKFTFNGKITCSKCGAIKNTNRTPYRNNVIKYGTEERFKAEYKCRGCR